MIDIINNKHKIETQNIKDLQLHCTVKSISITNKVFLCVQPQNSHYNGSNIFDQEVLMHH